MQVISVVRDFTMYDRLVKNNVYMQGATFTAIDNTEENLYITTRYNQFLQSYDYSQEDWFVFCHEDWEVKEDLAARLEGLDTNCLYGPIGKPYGTSQEVDPHFIGRIAESNKDGSDVRLFGTYSSDLAEVGTFDCQCLIVHSSVIQKYLLRFDEKLSFDLYVEDFCINAREKYALSSKILQLECQHYSRGNITERLHSSFDYFLEKYERAKYVYRVACFGTCVGNISNQYGIKKILVHLHIFYKEMWDEFSSYLHNLSACNHDLFVTLVEDNEVFKAKILAEHPHAQIVLVENRGFDVLPFIKIIQRINLDDYSYIVKLHTKRNIGQCKLNYTIIKNHEWRTHACSFLQSKKNFHYCIEQLQKKPAVGMIGNVQLFCYQGVWWKKQHDRNAVKKFTALLSDLHLPAKPFAFVAGTMFIVRANIFKPLCQIQQSSFEKEFAHTGLYAHAVERFFGYLVYHNGLELKDVLTPKKELFWLRVEYMLLQIKRFFFIYETNNKGKLRLKICKIPLPIHLINKK